MTLFGLWQNWFAGVGDSIRLVKTSNSHPWPVLRQKFPSCHIGNPIKLLISDPFPHQFGLTPKHFAPFMNMHRRSLALGAVLLSLLAAAPAALAQNYAFTFSDFTDLVSATGSFDAPGGLATTGSISITGAAFNGTFDMIALNRPQGTDSNIVTPSGANLTFDNLVSPLSTPVLTSKGLAFANASDYLGPAGNGYPEYSLGVNLWGNGDGSYSLWEGDHTQIQYNGTMTLTSIPEPSTYALLIGIFAFGFIIVRRQLSQTAVA